MRVIQSKFTKTNPYFFSKGGGGPVLDPPLLYISRMHYLSLTLNLLFCNSVNIIITAVRAINDFWNVRDILQLCFSVSYPFNLLLGSSIRQIPDYTIITSNTSHQLHHYCIESSICAACQSYACFESWRSSIQKYHH